MSELNKDWMPEVGQECEINFHSDDESMWFAIEWYGTKNGAPIFYDLDNVVREIVWSDSIEYSIRPIKSEADKLREVQIAELAHALYMESPVGLDSDEADNFAKGLLGKGCRMTRDLTEDDIAKYSTHFDITGKDISFAKAIEAHILGES